MSSHYYCDCDKRWQDNETCPTCHPDKFEAKNPDRESAIQKMVEALYKISNSGDWEMQSNIVTAKEALEVWRIVQGTETSVAGKAE